MTDPKLRLIELESLNEITLSISTTHELNVLIPKIITFAVSTLNARSGALMLSQGKSPILRLAGSFNINSEAVKKSIFTHKTELFKEAVHLERGFYQNNFQSAAIKRVFPFQNILIYPIQNLQGQTEGFLLAFDKENRRGIVPFDENDLFTLSAFVRHAGNAINTSRMIEHISASRQFNDAVLNSMTSGLITFNWLGEVTSANQSLLKIFNFHPLEIQNESFLFVFQSYPEISLIVEKTIQTNKNQFEQNVVLGDSAQIVNLKTSIMTDADGDRQGLILMVDDISAESRIKSMFKRYVSGEIVDELMSDESKIHLGGERKEVTILFSDIRGFTAMSETLEPEVVVSTLNEYFTRMIRIIFKHQGTLDKIVGDELMVIYGAPVSYPDDSKRAVATAVDMLIELKKLNSEREERGLNPLEIGIGINTGDAVVGNIGSPERMDYTVIGDTINLGARLCSAAKSGEILITEAVSRHIKGHFSIENENHIPVKGKKDPVKIYGIKIGTN